MPESCEQFHSERMVLELRWIDFTIIIETVLLGLNGHRKRGFVIETFGNNVSSNGFFRVSLPPEPTRWL